MSDRFATFDREDVRMLIADHPMAWVCAFDGVNGPEASQLPLVGEYDEGGALISVIGHLARANPLCAGLRTTGEALLLFAGPSAYVSPEHAGLTDWAPTWNYANLRIRTRVMVDEALTDEALDVLIDAMEAHRAVPWCRDAIAYRYAGMARAIIGFRAEVLSIEGRFKFSQDEADPVYHSILERLDDSEVTRWMRHLNPQR